MFQSIKNDFYYIIAGFDKKKTISFLKTAFNWIKVIVLFIVITSLFGMIWWFLGEDIIGKKTVVGVMYSVFGTILYIALSIFSSLGILSMREAGKMKLEKKMKDL